LDNVKKALGDRIRHYRELKGISQKALATALNADKGTVWRWEDGRSWPEYPAIVAISKHLGIRSEQLFETIGKAPPPTTVEQALLTLARSLYLSDERVQELQRLGGMTVTHESIKKAIPPHEMQRSDSAKEKDDRVKVTVAAALHPVLDTQADQDNKTEVGSGRSMGSKESGKVHIPSSASETQKLTPALASRIARLEKVCADEEQLERLDALLTLAERKLAAKSLRKNEKPGRLVR
jgi:transcriptional regulator with XRE-family HTH domain